MKNNSPIIHGPFQDDINYSKLFEMQAKQGVTRMPVQKQSTQLKGRQKVKSRRNK